MTRYLFGFIAIVTAVASVAFTKPTSSTKPLNVTFYFTGNPLLSADVADESKWNTTSPGNDCSGAANKACEITVSNDQTHLVNGIPQLNTSLNISAVAGAAGAASGYVPMFPYTGITARISRP